MVLFTQNSFTLKQKNGINFVLRFSLIMLISTMFAPLNAQVNVAVIKTDVTCNGYTNGSASASATGGVSPYTYQWSLGTSGNTLSGLKAGTYGVTATDANGKTGSASVTLVDPPVLGLNVTFADICNNGAITVSASGGNGGYSFNWGNGITGTTQTNLPKGGYNVVVTDAKGCAASKFIINPGTFSISLKIGKLRCFGDCDAAIDALPDGGTAPITYKWNTGVTTQSIVGIPSGTYSVTATDANGCTSSATGTVANPPQINISVAVNSPSCGGGANGSATATATGGVSPLTYKWSNGQTTATATGLNVGTYKVTVTDANGCIKDASVNIVTQSSFTIAIKSTDASCGSATGTASVTATGTTGTVTYKWSNNATTSSISNLPAGTYSVTVTDGSGCSSAASTTVNATGNLAIALSKTDASCGITNGIISVTVLTGTSPYKYAWSNGANTATINLLAAGTYTVTVTDANGCTASQSTTINSGSLLTIILDSKNVSCFSGSDGQATVMVQGGSTPYKYNWSNGGTTASIGGLIAGTYSVTVSDNLGCSNTGGKITITQPTQVNVTLSTTNNSCGSPSGSATASVSGGTAPYKYTWSNGGTTSTISNLSGGTYTVTVYDANGCSAISNATVNSTGNLSTSIAKTDASCGNSNGSATVTVLTGTAPYKYSWSNGSTAASISGLSAGTYSVTVSDANNCTSSQNVVVSSSSALTVSVTGVNVSCFGGNDGQASATVKGGNTPYKFNWSNGGNVNTIVNLTAGTYSLTVTDNSGCTSNGQVVVTQPTQIAITISTTTAACGKTNGSASADNVTGGTAPYKYQWSNGGTTTSISGVASGVYTLTVTDSKGCLSIKTATVGSTGSTINAVVTSSNGNCSGQGSAAVSVSSGVAPYTYSWSNGSTAVSISNLVSGSYTVTVTDAAGCSTVQSFTISTPTPISIVAQATGATCGNKNGSVATTVSGGTAPYTYSWSNGATTANLTNVGGGTYTLTTTDANGCFAKTVLTVTQTSGITLTTSTTNATCAPIGSATVVPTGGSGTYTYKWSNGGTTATIPNLLGGNYTVTVSDGTCSQTATVTVPSITTNLSCSVAITQNVGTAGASDGTLTVTVTGGAAPFSYKWSNNYTSATIYNLPAGTFTVTVTDKNGCTTSCFATLVNPTCDNVTSAGTITGDQKYCKVSELTAITEVTPATGGSGALIYMWMYNDQTDVFDMGSWNVVQGATGPNLTVFPAMTKSTFFRRCVRRAGCDHFLESNAVMKMPTTFVDITGPTAACLNQNVTFTAPDNGQYAQYQWSFAYGSPSGTNTRVATTKFTQVGPANVFLIVNVGGCYLSKNITVTVTTCVQGSGSISAFTVNPESNKKVLVNWETVDETKTSAYVVERSGDGTNFVEMGRLSSQNQNKNQYQFADTDPKMGHAFYRIKHLENSGDVSYSEMRQILLHNGNETSMVYPNPSNSKIFVELTDVANASGTIQVYNIQGLLMATQIFTADQIRYEVDMSALPIGNYYLKVTQDDGTIKVVKVNKQ